MFLKFSTINSTALIKKSGYDWPSFKVSTHKPSTALIPVSETIVSAYTDGASDSINITFTLLSSMTSITSTSCEGDISFAESRLGIIVESTSNPNLASKYPNDS